MQHKKTGEKHAKEPVYSKIFSKAFLLNNTQS
jgi:hypothetical protein